MTKPVITKGAMTENTVTSILSEWPDRAAVHADARAADADLDLVAVHRWFQRGVVPVKYWSALIEGARRRGIGLDADRLLAAHSATQRAA
jgi:hypothetical protein